MQKMKTIQVIKCLSWNNTTFYFDRYNGTFTQGDDMNEYPNHYESNGGNMYNAQKCAEAEGLDPLRCYLTDAVL